MQAVQPMLLVAAVRADLLLVGEELGLLELAHRVAQLEHGLVQRAASSPPAWK